MSDLMRFEEFQKRAEIGYRTHEALYRQQNPPPVRSRLLLVARIVLLYFMLVPLLVMVVAAIIVSGNNTVHRFAEVVTAAFVMIEIGAMIAAFRIARDAGENVGEHNRTINWILLGIASVVMVVVNLDEGFRTDATSTIAGFVPTPDSLSIHIENLFSAIIFLSAPLITIIAGHALAAEVARAGIAQRVITSEADAAMREWREGMNTSWSKQQARYGVSIKRLTDELTDGQRTDSGRTALPTGDLSVSERTSGQTARSGYGHKRTTDAVQKALVWFDANPQQVGLTVRELETVIGVGRDSISKARRQWYAQQNSAEAQNP